MYPYARDISLFHKLPGFNAENFPFFLTRMGWSDLLLCNYANFDVV